jgi:hypothetical protein
MKKLRHPILPMSEVTGLSWFACDYQRSRRLHDLRIFGLLPHTEAMIGVRFLPTVLLLAAGAINAQLTPVKVPLIGCETGGQVAVETPKASTASVPIGPGIAAKLAYYASGNGLGVLAPRGWFCFGTVGSGGDQLTVAPEPIVKGKYFSSTWPGFQGPVVHLTHRLGETSGRFSVAEVIMRVFPDHNAFAEGVRKMFPDEKFASGPYPGDKLVYKTNTVVEYVTPPRLDGLGTYWAVKKSDSPINGVAILIEQATPDLLLLSVRLPTSFNGTASTIVHQVERDAERHPELLRLTPFKSPE